MKLLLLFIVSLTLACSSDDDVGPVPTVERFNVTLIIEGGDCDGLPFVTAADLVSDGSGELIIAGGERHPLAWRFADDVVAGARVVDADPIGDWSAGELVLEPWATGYLASLWRWSTASSSCDLSVKVSPR